MWHSIALPAQQEEAMERVLFYAGEFGYVFSNFSAFMVDWACCTWMTSEHAYQAAKFDDPYIIDEIHAARSAYDALMLARKYENRIRPGWHDQKIDVMLSIIRAKLVQHEYVQKQLRKSGSAELIENSEKDSFWGRGPDWKGENMLGKLWMQLRQEYYPEVC